MNLDLFAHEPQQKVAEGAWLLRGFALAFTSELLFEIQQVIAQAPLRTMHTPSGLPLSVQTTSCGDAGWVSDAYGYRYARRNSFAQKRWPAMPKAFSTLAQQAASAAGFKHYVPDSCLINVYNVGAKMSLHQDKNEKDFSQPIVSVSLGLPATFLLGGLARENATQKIQLIHGDIIVWGGPARLFFHGVLPIKAGRHPLLGERRINLTFRNAL